MSLDLSVEAVSKWEFKDEDVAHVLVELDLIDKKEYQDSLACERK